MNNDVITRRIKKLLMIVACAIVLAIVSRYCFMLSAVDGMSMYPTLRDKELLVVNKAVYKASEPERFDIVIFATPLSDTGYYVKRVIGLPGETVQIDANGIIYINGEELDEQYGYGDIEDSGRASEPVVVGKDEYFVMGDNRNHSEDSRFALVGNIKKDKILGRVKVRIRPLDKFGYIDLYMERHGK